MRCCVNGMMGGELERPLLIKSTTARLSEYMRMDLRDHSCPHKMAGSSMG